MKIGIGKGMKKKVTLKLNLNKKTKREVVEFLKAMIFPVALLVFILISFSFTAPSSDAETAKTVFALVGGVVLGFTVEMLKRSLDQYITGRRLRKTAALLLERDAKEVFKNCVQYDKFLKNPNVPDSFKKSLPPPFRLRYWKKLKEDHSFLLLASDRYFHKVFSYFFQIEEINDQIERARDGDQQAYLFSHGFYKDLLEKQTYEEMLELFLGPAGVAAHRKTLDVPIDKQAKQKAA